MTSNLGASASEQNAIGFGGLARSGEDDKALKEFFRPELRNRIDKICKFNKLDKLAIKKIVVKFTDELQQSLNSKNIKLTLSEPVIDLLADKGYDPLMGARPLSRKIDELIRVPLSKKILFDRLSDCSINAYLENDTVMFTVQPNNVTPVVSDDGIIRFPDAWD